MKPNHSSLPTLFLLLSLGATPSFAQDSALPKLPTATAGLLATRTDWLLDASSFTAGVFRGEASEEIVLQNGLLRRTFKLAPNATTVGLDNLMTGAAMLRAVEPEATITIDGQEFKVGGLRGQPDRAYLLPEWTAKLTNDPGAFQFTGYATGKPAAPFAWKRKRHSAGLPWPPPGAAPAPTVATCSTRPGSLRPARRSRASWAARIS
jgi:hypothetical protein